MRTTTTTELVDYLESQADIYGSITRGEAERLLFRCGRHPTPEQVASAVIAANCRRSKGTPMTEVRFVEKTVWIYEHGDGHVAVRSDGTIIAQNKYRDSLTREVSRMASDPSSNIVAIAIVTPAKNRKPTTNKPPTQSRPR